MRHSNQDIPRVDTPREELHDIYESALVEARPLDAPDAEWQELVSLVTKRGQGGVVITGWNPGQLRPTLAVNQEANSRLLEALKRTNYEIWEADGFSPDRSFREPGFIAWGMDPNLGCSLARDFGQFAIFFYKSDGSREVIAVKGH